MLAGHDVTQITFRAASHEERGSPERLRLGAKLFAIATSAGIRDRTSSFERSRKFHPRRFARSGRTRAGASRRRLTPMPRGSRHWTAAFTRSGA